MEVGEEDPAGAPSLGVRVRQERVPAALMGSHLRFPGPLTMWLAGRLCFLCLVAARFEEKKKKKKIMHEQIFQIIIIINIYPAQALTGYTARHHVLTPGTDS